MFLLKYVICFHVNSSGFNLSKVTRYESAAEAGPPAPLRGEQEPGRVRWVRLVRSAVSASPTKWHLGGGKDKLWPITSDQATLPNISS